MDLLLAILLITYVIKNAITDTAYAVRGQTPPRLRIRWEKERRRATGRTETTGRYGMTGYFRDLWHDSWEDARTHRATKRAERSDEKPAASPATTPKPAAPLAVVTPIRTEQKGDRVNRANPETTTLSAAKAYAHQMADAATQASASVEQTRAHLSANQVGGDVQARLAEAQELASQLAAKFKAAYDELAKQDTVKDAYQAVPDAGSKEFVTQE